MVAVLELAKQEFDDFEQFSKAVLGSNKKDSYKAVLDIAVRAQSIGQAFSVAYRCAMQRLLPQLEQDQWAAMCISEVGGNHPKKILTQLDAEGRLSGQKSFITMADKATQLLVLARSFEQGSEQVKLTAVLAQQPDASIQFTPMPAIGMLPDVAHGQMQFTQTQCEILPGDGYAQYSKPFRTLEDSHVLMGFCAFILGKSLRLKLDAQLIERSLLILHALPNDSDQQIHSAEYHLLLASAFDQFAQLANDFESQLKIADSLLYEDWMRDKKLFSIAKQAREARRDKARQQMMM